MGFALSRRSLLASTILASVTAKANAAFFLPATFLPPAASGFHPLLVGAGGYILTQDISPDGLTRLITKDAGGANIWNAATSNWDQLISTARMPATDAGPGIFMGGSYFAVSAPNLSSTIYMAYGPNLPTQFPFVFKSTDRGLSFARTTFTSASLSTGENYKLHSPKAAVDPANSNVLYIGVPPIAATFTASGANLTSTQNLQVGEAVQLTTTGTLPGNLALNTVYWVVAAGAAIQLSATRGGSPITTSGAGSGTHTLTSAAAYVTADGGTSWAVVPSIPIVGNTQPALGICFDPTSSVTGSKTQGIYIWIAGSGLYHSINGGTSFSLVGSSPSLPTGTVLQQHGRISSDGVYYLSLGNDATSGKVWSLSGSTWTDLSAALAAAAGGPATPASVCTDPNTAGTVVVISDGGNGFISANHGSSFTLCGPIPTTRSATAPDVVWLQNTNENSMSVGDICFDPITANRLWFSEGIGLWFSSTASSGASMNAYTSQSRGIEQLINNQIIHPPGGNVLLACWDRPVFTLNQNAPGIYPTFHGPNYTNQVELGNAVDWATSDPAFVVVLADISAQAVQEQSSFSTTGGASGSWSLFASNPGSSASGFVGGNIAVSTHLNMVWAQGNKGDLYNTTNGGASWSKIAAASFTDGGSASGVQNAPAGGGGTGGTGWSSAYFDKSFNVCADRQTTGVFYGINSQTAALGGGSYKSTDSGATWQRQSTTLANPTATAFNVTLTAVPSLAGANVAGVGGLVMFGAGEGQYPFLVFSRNGGALWSKVGTGAQQAGSNFCFGFGAIKSGNDFPSVFFVGYVNSVYGIYRSDNSYADWVTSSINGSNEITPITWTLLGQTPLGNSDEIIGIDGDKNVWGKCYLATANSGCFYYIA